MRQISENLVEFGKAMRSYDKLETNLRGHNEPTIGTMMKRYELIRETSFLLRSFKKRTLPDHYEHFVSLIDERIAEIEILNCLEEDVMFGMIVPADKKAKEESYQYN